MFFLDWPSRQEEVLSAKPTLENMDFVKKNKTEEEEAKTFSFLVKYFIWGYLFSWLRVKLAWKI